MKKEEIEFEDLIEKAKQRVSETYGGGIEREWLECSPKTSYGRSDYKVSLFVLQGSPPKGYVLADSCYGIVRGFGVRLSPVCVYKLKGKICL